MKKIPWALLIICWILLIVSLITIVLITILIIRINKEPENIPQENEAIVYLNTYRNNKGFSPIETSTLTCKVAEIRLEDIQTDFSHELFKTRVANLEGYWTENLAKGYVGSKDVVNAWSKSIEHNKNLLADTPQICIKYKDNRWVMIGLKEIK